MPARSGEIASDIKNRVTAKLQDSTLLSVSIYILHLHLSPPTKCLGSWCARNHPVRASGTDRMFWLLQGFLLHVGPSAVVDGSGDCTVAMPRAAVWALLGRLCTAGQGGRTRGPGLNSSNTRFVSWATRPAYFLAMPCGYFSNIATMPSSFQNRCFSA
jgi:hypothetical protein